MHRRLFPTLLLSVVLGCSLACSKLPSGPNDTTWRFLPGHVEPLKVPAFRNGRECWIYLPPGYATSERRYPVLYMHDGRDVFDGGVHANRIAEDLIRRGEIEPIIIVAISVASEEREFEYTPYPATFDPHGGGDNYVRAIRDTLKPEVDRRFRTKSDAPNTAISGCSLGGLISAYAGLEYDSTFSKVGAFSPTYDYGFPEFRDILLSRRPAIIRYYHDTGQFPFDNQIAWMDQFLVQTGFVTGVTLMSVTVQGAWHTGTAWEHRFPDMLRFLFPKPSS